MKRFALLFLIITLPGILMSGLASAAIVAVTNQDNADPGSLAYVTGDILRATSFTTGIDWTLLVSADLKVASRNEIGVEMTLTATVYENKTSQSEGDLPGGVVAAFDALPFSKSVEGLFEDITFTSAGILLRPQTKYWLAVGGNAGVNADYLATSLNTQSSTLGWTIGDSDTVTLIAPDTWLQTGGSNPIRFTLNVEPENIPSDDVLYGFIHGESGAVLATISFSEPPASFDSPWSQASSWNQITGATLDYSSLGGPSFDWGVNVISGGEEGLIDNISINNITSDGRTLNGGSTAVRFFVSSGQSEDPRYNVSASISASPAPGADSFNISDGGSNNGGVIDPEWVGVSYSGDWVYLPDVIYRFRQAGTGTVLATLTFKAPTALSTSPWGQEGRSGLITGATLDFSALGGPTFDWGENILAGGSDGLIDNISANTITADGRFLDGGSTAIRFITSDQIEDPRFNVSASISASSAPGADSFTISNGGTNNGGAIPAEWVGTTFFGDWDAEYLFGNGFEN